MSKRRGYTVEFKTNVIKFAEQHSNRETGRQFQIDESMVRRWVQNKDRLNAAYEQPGSSRLKIKLGCGRRPSLPTFVHVEKCQTRWRTLRTAYGKRHRRRIETLHNSGAIEQETWQYYDQLSFLDNYIKHRGYDDYFTESPSSSYSTQNNISNSQEEDTEDTDGTEGNLAPSTDKVLALTGQGSALKRTCDWDDGSPQAKELKKSLEQLVQVQVQSLDISRCESFGKFVSNELLSKPRHLLPYYMKEITKVLCNEPTIDMNITESEDLNNT